LQCNFFTDLASRANR